MAASALKMAAICAVLLILLSSAGQPAMAYADGGLSCPSAATPCRTQCASVCNEGAPVVCNKLCGLSPSGLDVVDQGCVNHFFSICMAVCKNMCEP